MKPSPTPILSQINEHTSSTRNKDTPHLLPVNDSTKEATTFRQPVRSLIPPIIPIRIKTEPKTIRKRRNSSSSASVKSFTSVTSSMLSRMRQITSPTPTLVNVPAEILDSIIQYLPQSALHSLLFTNTSFIERAAYYLYTAPYFASTYRYAQFVYTVSHKPYYAEMVRDLDLSYFAKQGLDRLGETMPMAGWREFKYRNQDMHYARDRLGSGGRNAGVSNHPTPSPFLKSFHRTRDIPIGGLCHILAACKGIRKINLNRLQLASDFLLTSPSLFPPTSSTNLIFVSDVPKSWAWASTELQPIYADFVISHLTTLPCLQILKARNCLWLTTSTVDRLMREARESLEKVDFRESGMQKDCRWAIKSTRREVERIVGESLGNRKDVGAMVEGGERFGVRDDP